MDKELLAKLKAELPTYNGWEFDYMWPGCMSYYKGYVRVFFEPDYNVKGCIDQQIQDEYGLRIEDERLKRFDQVPYSKPLTVEQLFAAAKPMMDAVDEIVAKEPNFGYNPDAHRG